MSSSPSVSARTGASTVVASSAVSSAAPSAPANLHVHVGATIECASASEPARPSCERTRQARMPPYPMPSAHSACLASCTASTRCSMLSRMSRRHTVTGLHPGRGSDLVWAREEDLQATMLQALVRPSTPECKQTGAHAAHRCWPMRCTRATACCSIDGSSAGSSRYTWLARTCQPTNGWKSALAASQPALNSQPQLNVN